METSRNPNNRTERDLHNDVFPGVSVGKVPTLPPQVNLTDRSWPFIGSCALHVLLVAVLSCPVSQYPLSISSQTPTIFWFSPLSPPGSSEVAETPLLRPSVAYAAQQEESGLESDRQNRAKDVDPVQADLPETAPPPPAVSSETALTVATPLPVKKTVETAKLPKPTKPPQLHHNSVPTTAEIKNKTIPQEAEPESERSLPAIQPTMTTAVESKPSGVEKVLQKEDEQISRHIIEQKQQAAETLHREQLAREQEQRAIKERLEQERAAVEKGQQKQLAAEKLHREQIAQKQEQQAIKERLEQERAAVEKDQQKQLAAEKLHREQIAQKQEQQAIKERLEQERAVIEKARQKQLAAEKLHREQIAREQEQRAIQEKLEQERQATQKKLEQERVAIETARQKQLAREKEIQKRRSLEEAMHKLEMERVARDKAEQKMSALTARQNTPALKQSKNAPEPQSPIKPTEKPMSVSLPLIKGDLKLVITGSVLPDTTITFTDFAQSRRDRPLSRAESRRRTKIIPLIAHTRGTTREVVIAQTKPGVYTFTAEPAGDPAKVTLSLKLYEGSSRAVSRELGTHAIIAQKKVLFKILMPEGILWDDNTAFSGNMEDSDGVTKFNTNTGLMWKEYSE